MTYYLDFDRTIFDTPSFKRDFKFPFRFLFPRSQLAKYLYPDVPPFLETYGEQTTIVTYGVPAFIRAKVTNALAGMNLRKIIYTPRKKGRVIQRLAAVEEGPHVFVDDAHFQLASVEKWCPNVEIIEIRRDGKPAAGRWPVIHSLDMLSDILS